MKIIKALLILISVTVAGNILSSYTGGILPGSVIGMIILFLLLITGAVKLDTVQETSLYLVAHLSLFILPAAVSVITVSGLTVKDLLLLTAVTAVSTLLTMSVTAVVTELLLKLSGENNID